MRDTEKQDLNGLCLGIFRGVEGDEKIAEIVEKGGIG